MKTFKQWLIEASGSSQEDNHFWGVVTPNGKTVMGEPDKMYSSHEMLANKIGFGGIEKLVKSGGIRFVSGTVVGEFNVMVDWINYRTAPQKLQQLDKLVKFLHSVSSELRGKKIVVDIINIAPNNWKKDLWTDFRSIEAVDYNIKETIKELE